MTARWLFLASFLLLWDRRPGQGRHLDPPSQQCCPWKKVGAATYSFLRTDAAALDQGCKTHCVYRQDVGGGSFCFIKDAQGADAQCLEIPTAASTSASLTRELQDVKKRSEAALQGATSEVQTIKLIVLYLNKLKTEISTGESSADGESTTSCNEITTRLEEVKKMLTEGSEKFNITKALEITTALDKLTVKDIHCSEEELKSLNGDVAAAEEQATLYVETQIALVTSVSEALATFCPGSVSPSLTTPSTETTTVQACPVPGPAINKASLLDFFDSAISLQNKTYNTSCCLPDLSQANVTCGEGVSCGASCSALGAVFCPTEQCTGDQRDCQPSWPEEPQEQSGRQSRRVAIGNLPSGSLSWCPDNCRWVAYYPACCLHPVCYRTKKKKCTWLASYTGESCPPPANPPHGTWTCGEQEIPIPGATSILDGEYTTFKALQCRLFCDPGFIAAKPPVITCSNGRFTPSRPATHFCQPAAAVIVTSRGEVELLSTNSRCNQKVIDFPGLSTSGHTVDLLDSQLLIVGDKDSLGSKWKYLSIKLPRRGLLAVTYYKAAAPVKGRPFRHTSMVQGNNLYLLGGEKNTRARLETSEWKTFDLRINEESFENFTSSGCISRLTKDTFISMGGIYRQKNKQHIVSSVVKINITEQTVVKLPQMVHARSFHSCELLNSTHVIISGGRSHLDDSETNIVPDELYNTITGHSEVLDTASSLARAHHRLIRLENTVFAIGGMTADGGKPKAVKTFNTQTRSWESYSELQSHHTGELAVTAFPLSSVDCVAGCRCGGATIRASRIGNGQEAEVNAYPWIAALVIDNEKDPDYVQSTCSAVLIGSNWMVTAAHCLYRQEVLLPATSLTLVLGLHDKSDSTEGTRKVLSVSEVFVHENYASISHKDDIALLRLSERVDLFHHAPVCLPGQGDDFTGKTASVYGWGATGTFSSHKLMEAQVPIISDTQCREALVQFNMTIEDNMLCAGGGKAGACKGDSGGPLTVIQDGAHTLVGVVSHRGSEEVAPCGQEGSYEVFMEVSRYISWLNSTILRAGGMASCSYILTADPVLGGSPQEEISDGVLLTGGRDSNLSSVTTVEFFGPVACLVPALPEPRSGHVTFVTGGGAVASCGGWTEGFRRSKQCVVLSLAEQQWNHGVIGDLVWTQAAMSPNYPNNYPDNTDITYPIEVEIGKIVELTFVVFDIEMRDSCDMDWFQVTDGDGTTLMEKSCSGKSIDFADLPSNLISHTNRVIIIFHSDHDTSGKGFYVTWRPLNGEGELIAGQRQDTGDQTLGQGSPPPGLPYAAVSLSAGVYVMHHHATSFLPSDSMDWLEGPSLFISLECAVKISEERFLVIGGQDRKAVSEFDSVRAGATSNLGWLPGDTWSDLRHGRVSPACAVWGGRLVVAGEGTVDIVYLATKALARGEDMLRSRRHFNLAPIGEEGYTRLLALGGAVGLAGQSSVEVMAEDGVWQEATGGLSAARSHSGAVSLAPGMVCTAHCEADKCPTQGAEAPQGLIIAGGMDNGYGFLDSVDTFSLSSSTCTIPVLPTGLWGLSLTLVDRDSPTLVFCGGDEDDYSSRCLEWQRGHEMWTHFATMGEERFSHSAAGVEGGKLMLLGGGKTSTSQTTGEIQPGGSKFNLTHPGSGSCALSVMEGREVVIIGGGYREEDEVIRRHHTKTDRYSSEGEYLGALPDLSQQRSSHGCVAFTNSTGTYYMVTGGADDDGPLASSEVLGPLPGASSWRVVAPLPVALQLLACSTLPGGQVLCAGGLEGQEGQDGDKSSAVYRYSPQDDTWNQAATMEAEIFSHAMVGADLTFCQDEPQ